MCIRDRGRKFELQIPAEDGAWQTIHQGQVFGMIYAKKFSPVTAPRVRLKIDATAVRQLDLFAIGL